MADPIPVSEIPTATLLYKLRHITPEEHSSGGSYSPNALYNDKIALIRADITTLGVDAIVNAANKSLLGGGGVDGAIHRAAGPELLDECETLNGCETGSAKITDGYRLPAKKVIHAVGPIYWVTKGQGTHATLLAGCYRKSLELAVKNGCKSIAFSALSTGVYGYPSGEACQVALKTVREFFDKGEGDKLESVVFCNFMEKDEDAYYRYLPRYFPPATESDKPAPTTDESEKQPEEPASTSDDAADLASKLPDPPTTEPTNPDEPSAKKQKTEVAKEEDTEDEYVVIDKEEAKGFAEAGVAPPKADL